MPTTQEVFANARRMSAAERLRLAAMLLEDVAQTLPPDASMAITDVEYTDDELRQVAARSLEYAARLYGDEADLLPAPISATAGN